MPIAAVPIIAIALVALVFAWALWNMFHPFIVQALSQVPVIGGYVVGAADSMLWRVWNAQAGWASSALYPLATLVWVPVHSMETLYNLLTDGLSKLHNQHAFTVYQRLPEAVNRAVNYTTALHQQAINYAEALHQQAVNYAQALHQQAVNYAEALHAQAINYAQALHQQAINYVEALHAQAITYAQALHAQATQYAEALHAQAITYAQALQAQALNYADQLYQRSLEYEQRLFGQSIDYTERTHAQENAYAQTLYQQAVTYAEAAAGAVAAQVIELEGRPCMRFCDPLGGLGQALQEIEDLAMVAVLVELAVDGIHDPRGTAQAVTGALGGLVQDAAADVRQLAGIGAR